MAAQRLLAELMSITEERPNDPRHIVVSVPWLWDPDPATARAQFAALTPASWVNPQPLSALLERDVPTVGRESLPDELVATAELGRDDLDSIRHVQDRWTEFAQISAEPDLVTTSVDATVTTLTSAAARAYPVTRAAARSALADRVTAAAAAVTTVPGSEISIGGADVRLPVIVVNRLQVAVTVDVRLSGSPAVRVPDTVRVSIGPGDTVTTWVPVTALANGPAVVKVDLLGPDGSVIGPGADLQVNVRAEWDTWVTLVAAIGLTVLVIAGGLRTIRRRRGTRAEQLAAEEAES